MNVGQEFANTMFGTSLTACRINEDKTTDVLVYEIELFSVLTFVNHVTIY